MSNSGHNATKPSSSRSIIVVKGRNEFIIYPAVGFTTQPSAKLIIRFPYSALASECVT
jgi:hypothetical protein